MIDQAKCPLSPMTVGDPRAASGGFALVSVLILLVVLTGLAAAGFLVSNGEYRISQAHAAGSRAFHTADAAMYEHMGTNRRGTNSVSYTFASGSAQVGGTQLIDLGDGNTLHRITATGTHTPPNGGGAVREIELIAMMHDAGFKANAALTAGSGLLKNGGSGALDGWDQTTPSDCSAGSQPSVAGVATGPGEYTQTGGSPVPTGNPPLDQSQSGYDHLADLGLDWGGLLGGDVVTPDFTIPGDPWPDFGSMDPDWWPVIYVDGPAAVSPVQNGRGTLIVRNSLTINGSWQWNGIVLVGDAILANGNNTVSGTAIAGLNELLGQSVPPSSIANGDKQFLFHSCWVRTAAQQFLGGLIEVPGTWSESM
ncbi:MAG: hypothetical protein R3266_15915 [Gemmatimonadota bacterium]|nr:hypothetical protein [Gemmatimonadota bacterium]